MAFTPARLVVGLGNPGPDYAATRHNAGFRIVEALAAREGASFSFDDALAARWAACRVAGLDCALVLPETFMNRSGQCVAAALRRWPALVPETDLLVVYDDLDLPLGRVRLRPRGRAAGHRGLGDITRALATEALPRLRFGIGHPGSAGAVIDWVLEPFAPEEEAELPAAIARAVEAIDCALREGLGVAMDRFNGSP